MLPIQLLATFGQKYRNHSLRHPRFGPAHPDMLLAVRGMGPDTARDRLEMWVGANFAFDYLPADAPYHLHSRGIQWVLDSQGFHPALCEGVDCYNTPRTTRYGVSPFEPGWGWKMVCWPCAARIDENS